MSEKKKTKKFHYRFASCEIGTLEAANITEAGRIASKKADAKKTCVSYIKEVN